MRCSCVYILLGACAWLCFLLPVVSAQESPRALPSAAELISLAPILDSGDVKCHRIKTRVHLVKDDGDISYVALYQAPNHFAVCLADRADNTPIVYINDRQLILYNPLESGLVYASHGSFEYLCDFHEDRFHSTVAISAVEENNKVRVDVKSMFAEPSVEQEVMREDEKKFRLTTTTRKGYNLVAFIDSSRRCPFKQIQITKKGKSEGGLFIRELTVDEDLNESWPVFPPKGRLLAKLQITDLSDVPERNLIAYEFFQRAVAGRMALRKKSLRDEYESQFHTQVDWDKAELENRRNCRLIKEVFGASIEFAKGAPEAAR